MKTLALSALLLLPASTMMAESITAQMNVSVRVVAGAKVEMGSDALTIDEADVARGYVEVALPLSVRTNSRQGYVLVIQNVSPVVAGAELVVGNAQVRVVAESFLQRPYVAGGERMEIRGRLQLTRDAQPGHYAHPIRVTATAL